jgi:transposase
MKQCSAYVGLDVHKETVAVAVALPGRQPAQYLGEIKQGRGTLRRLIWRLSTNGERLSFCYEAGPCGYGLYREIEALGHHCEVVAPSLIPRKAGERIKTDRRDALSLARQHRAGELTAVWVPGPEQEAMRDLTRAREDMKAIELKARQRLGAFLLRHGRVYSAGRKRWTQQYFRWLETQTFGHPAQPVVFQEYIDAVRQAQSRVKGLEDQMRSMLPDWSLSAVVEALRALRGVELITAMTVLAELGDLTRFDSPRQLMSFLGLVPGEHSSGRQRRQGRITKTGNGHVRRVLIEAAWSYRFAARKTAHLRRKAAGAPARVQAIAWAAQKRLCGRYRSLYQAGKAKPKVCTAIARELVGFIWAIACEIDGKPHGTRGLAI